MRNFSFSRPLSFYIKFIAVPVLVMTGCIVGLWFWQQSLPDKTPIAWEQLTPKHKLRPWQYIVMHHSDSLRGSTAGIDRYHREHNGWDGIGYHFVVGNGRGMRNGRIEYSFRWNQQREGAHAGGKDKIYNEQGIGICLIGDFQDKHPDPFQIQRTATLCACLIESIPGLHVERIIGHNNVPGKETKCPGQHFNMAQFRSTVRDILGQRLLQRMQASQQP